MLSNNSLRFYLPIFRITSVYNHCKFRNLNLWLYDIGNKIFKKGYVKGDNTVHKRLKYERYEKLRGKDKERDSNRIFCFPP